MYRVEFDVKDLQMKIAVVLEHRMNYSELDSMGFDYSELYSTDFEYRGLNGVWILVERNMLDVILLH